MRKTTRRFFRYAPLIGLTTLILGGSGDELSASNTSRVLGAVLRFINPNITDSGIEFANLVFRKAGHFSVYALLALLAAFAFLSSSKTTLKRNGLLLASLFVACVSLIDEYSQSFSPSRTGTFYDCLIDMAGGLTALGVIIGARKVLNNKG